MLRRKKTVVDFAWLEWVVSRQLNANETLPVTAIVEMPHWFVKYELGFELGFGPSIVWTAQHLEQINHTHRELLAGKERKSQLRKKSSAEQRREYWLQVIYESAYARRRDRLDLRRQRSARAQRVAA